ncbi:C-C motif chemokine 36.1 isoform X2 [Acanthochromis polyacanthus]|uniref:C-C motif chemokine 36.1 isoform X2 n=1 Tax=Acanthochromis polyacanthus TaxID=80966 RepID=UPI002234135D|nr:C-C motif chemokine 36.1 isoform X2 [Acanthochromis polyacanthus]
MRTAYILLLCVLGAAMLSTVTCNNAIGPDQCCFSYYPRRMNKNVVVSYYMTENRCAKLGVVLVTKQSRRICADPSLSWVEGIMKDIDEKSF